MKSVKKFGNHNSFPRLVEGKLTGIVVLITKETGEGECAGTVVHGNEVSKLGEYYKNWNMSQFKPFNGTIILSNEESIHSKDIYATDIKPSVEI